MTDLVQSEFHMFLQQYWWVIVSLLGAVLVFLMFVQGGQTLFYQVGKNDEERTILINTIGRKWELTFTTLVTFGGAFFASFPLFYSTSFGGAYWVWLLILLGFILQAVSFEFRKKPGNFFGSKVYEIFLLLNGILATVLIGAAVGTFFSGSAFSIDEMRLSKWEHPARGLEAALNILNLSLGLAVFFLARTLGALHFINAIVHEEIEKRARKQLIINAVLFLVFFLTFLVLLLTSQGFAVNPETSEVYMEDYKYLHNFLDMPLVLILFLIGVIAVLTGIFTGYFKKKRNGFWWTSAGTVMAVLALLMVAGFNNTAFYPSVYDLQSSLTIYNSSSSEYTLKTMMYVSFFVPFVIAYIWFAWRAINKKKVDAEEIEESKNAGEHVY